MKYYRLNQQIRAAQLRVIDQQGKQLGVIPRDEAFLKAQQEGLDLVEIAPNASPPVAKIIDFKKFLYLEEKKQRESKKKIRASGMKELRLGPFISENDFQVRLGRAKEFLKGGYKVRLAVKFAGRQITHPEFGWGVINRCIKELEDFGRIEREPRFEGRILAASVTPGKGSHGKQNEEEKQSKVN